MKLTILAKKISARFKIQVNVNTFYPFFMDHNSGEPGKQQDGICFK